MKIRKMITDFAAALVLSITFAGCNQAERVSYNLSKEADNFNDIRQVTVINCIEGDILFQMTGKMSITADTSDNHARDFRRSRSGLPSRQGGSVPHKTAAHMRSYSHGTGGPSGKSEH